MDTSKEDEVPTMPVSSSHMITYYFRNGSVQCWGACARAALAVADCMSWRCVSGRCVATIRPSGTEPKIKYYIEMPGSNPEEAR